MSRLNGTIRFSVTFMNTFIFLLGIITIGGGAYLVSSTGSRFNSSTLNDWLAWIVIAGLVFLALSITGCCGTFHQTLRKGWCSGRRVLSLYQVLLLGVIIACVCGVLAIRAIRSNFKYVQAYPSSPLDHTERSMMSPYFNTAYYKAAANYVVNKDGFKWFAAWVHTYCPASMDVFSCKSCTAATYSSSTCCPMQSLCEGGNMGACPYYRCRASIASYLGAKLKPWQSYIFIAIIIQLALMVNTCLLICYNPRDTLSDLLTKTGIVMHKGAPKRRTPRGNTPRGGTPNRQSGRRTPVGQSPRSTDMRGVKVEAPRSPRGTPSAAGSPGSDANRAPQRRPTTPRRSIDGRVPGGSRPLSPTDQSFTSHVQTMV